MGVVSVVKGNAFKVKHLASKCQRFESESSFPVGSGSRKASLVRLLGVASLSQIFSTVIDRASLSVG
jgi:hypothetical protein